MREKAGKGVESKRRGKGEREREVRDEVGRKYGEKGSKRKRYR